MSNESTKDADVLSWRRNEPSTGGVSGSATPRGSSRGRGRGRGRGGRNEGGPGPGQPESSPRSGRRRGPSKQADTPSATNPFVPNPNTSRHPKPVVEDKVRHKSPLDSVNLKKHDTQPHTFSKGTVGTLSVPKLNVDFGPSSNVPDVLSPATDGGVKKNGSRKNSSRQSHRRTKSAATLKPSPIIVLDKSVRSATGSPSTPNKDLPPHLATNPSKAAGLLIPNEELEQVIEHLPTEYSTLHTPGFPEGHIDWAQDDDDEELPDLDDWGITTAKPSEEHFSDTASRCTVESASPPIIESNSPEQKQVEIHDGDTGSDDKSLHSTSQLETPQMNERRRTRGRDRDRGSGKSKNVVAPASSTVQELDDSEVPRLPNGQKKSLIDRIGPNPLLSLPSSISTADGSPPKSPSSLPHHPSLPPKPSVSPFASNFNPNSLSLKPMSDWRRSASRSRSPSKEPLAVSQTSTLDSMHTPASVRTAALDVNIDPGTGVGQDGSAAPATSFLVNHLEVAFQGNPRPQGSEAKPQPGQSSEDIPRRPRRERSPFRNNHGPRSHSTLHPRGGGPSTSSRPSRSRQTNAARPVISVDALKRISRSLKGSPTPPRLSSPVPNNVAATAE